MYKSALIASGTGYADDTSFDDYEVIRHPLPERESRILGREPDGSRGVCYRAYDIKLAIAKPRTDLVKFRDRESSCYILMQHGGGTRVIRIGGTYDNGEMLEGLRAMPEVALYGLLFSIYQMVSESITVAQQETAREWMQAAVDKRIKVGRIKRGARSVTITPVADPLAP